MKRSLFLAACLATLLAVAMTSAGAAPGGSVPITGASRELSFSGTFTVTGFAAVDKELRLEGTLDGPLSTSNGGIEADLSDSRPSWWWTPSTRRASRPRSPWASSRPR